MTRAIINETGNRYGRLLVLGRADKRYGRGEAYWWCHCDCGDDTVVRGNNLRSGNTKSCGCLWKERVREANTLPNGEASFNDLVYKMKHNAKVRGLEWQLTKEQVRHLTKQSCHYCNGEPSQTKSGRNYNGVYVYNGIDRVDNTKGYTIDNVVPCCETCNRMKLAMTLEDFRVHVLRICEHFATRKVT